MSVFMSRVDREGASFAQNRAAMLALVASLREIEGRAAALSEQRKARFAERGQLTPRERIARLLDPGMPFLALHSLANFLVEDRNPETSVPGASLIAGIGLVSGVRALVWADDSGIKAGAIAAATLPTILSLQKIALRQNCR